MPLAAPNAGLAEYRAHLRLLRAWLAPAERWLAGFDDPGPLPPRARTPLIDADLALLAPEAGEPFLRICTPPWSAQASAAYRQGVAYVIEGSQLGGAVLARRLGARLDHPLRYLRGDGPPGPRWQAALAALDATVQTPAQIEEACAGARAAFGHLLDLLRLNPALAALPEGHAA